MTKPIVLEQVSLPGFADNDNDGRVTAHGRTLHLDAWARVTGIDEQTLRSRLRSGWSAERALSEPQHTTNRRVSDAFEVPWGAPGSWTWDWLDLDLDVWARRFLAEHPGGASVEEVCEAMGLADSRLREVEQQALMKLRGLVLDGDQAARDMFCEMFGPDALDQLVERFGDSAPDMTWHDEPLETSPLFGAMARGAA